MDQIDYKKLIKNLNKNNGNTDIEFRKKMAQKHIKKFQNMIILFQNG